MRMRSERAITICRPLLEFLKKNRRELTKGIYSRVALQEAFDFISKGDFVMKSWAHVILFCFCFYNE